VILMRGTVETGRTSIEHHRGGLPDDAARGRPGDTIRTGMVASTGRASAAANPDAGGNEAWAAACRPWAPGVRAPAGQRAACPPGRSPSPRGPLEEKDGLAAILGGRRNLVQRVCHVGGKAVSPDPADAFNTSHALG
jgi:hypothetical protein